MKRKILISTLIFTLIFTLTACNSVMKESKDDVEKKVEVSEPKQDKLNEAYTAYLDVLSSNKNQIQAYNWQQEANENHSSLKRQTALCDINNDTIPELFFFERNDSQSRAVLNIYSYIDNVAKKLEYTCSSSKTYVQDDISPGFYDTHAASGTSYVVYKSTKNNHFFIYSLIGDETAFYRLNEFKVDKTGVIKEVNVLENDFGYISHSDVFRQNGKEITSDTFASEFKNALGSIEKVILYSGYDDTTIWGKFKGSEALSKSYEEMINYLKDETDTNNITNKKDVDEISFADIAGQYCGIASNITISENGSYTCGTGIRNEGSGKAKLIENKDGHYQLELVGDCAGVYDLYFNANASDMPTDISNLNPSYPTNILHNTSNDQYYVIQNLQ